MGPVLSGQPEFSSHLVIPLSDSLIQAQLYYHNIFGNLGVFWRRTFSLAYSAFAKESWPQQSFILFIYSPIQIVHLVQGKFLDSSFHLACLSDEYLNL